MGKLLSEEDIRSSIIIPMLIAIGIEPGEISLEKTFTIQLGRGVYTITNEERKIIGGRLDILCKVAGKNFIVIECKAENIILDKEKDSQQGLSYARLLQPMAPYVLVTNGKNTYLFDTILGTEINSSQLAKSPNFISLDEEIALRYDGMKKFIGYSIENLTRLSQSISERHLKLFISSEKDTIEEKLRKKYIPEAFIERSLVQSSFQEFVNQKEKHLYVITGESGVGKTNAIIYLFNQINLHPAIFYSGTLLGSSFLEELKFDFNLEFSAQETAYCFLQSPLPFALFLYQW